MIPGISALGMPIYKMKVCTLLLVCLCASQNSLVSAVPEWHIAEFLELNALGEYADAFDAYGTETVQELVLLDAKDLEASPPDGMGMTPVHSKLFIEAVAYLDKHMRKCAVCEPPFRCL